MKVTEISIWIVIYNHWHLVL